MPCYSRSQPHIMLAYALLLAVKIPPTSNSLGIRPENVFAYNLVQAQGGSHGGQLKRPPNTIVTPKGEKPIQVPSYVNVSGNFGGVFYVSGVGSGLSQTQTNVVSVTTNRSLTFAANAFKPLTLGPSAESTMGSVAYSMSIYQGTPSRVGALVAGPVSGTDSGFNGQVLTLTTAPSSSPEPYVLVITRTLSLTGQATGACTLVGTGYIGVTIN